MSLGTSSVKSKVMALHVCNLCTFGEKSLQFVLVYLSSEIQAIMLRKIIVSGSNKNRLSHYVLGFIKYQSRY